MPQLAEKLDAIVPVKSPTRTHFANSGTEADDTAVHAAKGAQVSPGQHRALVNWVRLIRPDGVLDPTRWPPRRPR